MILAVPILIAVSLFLGWALFVLAVNALPLFSGVSAGLLVFGWSESIAGGLIAGLAVSATVALIGPVAFSRARSQMSRLAILVAFAGPAAAAAYDAVLGLSGHLGTSGAVRTISAVAAAFLVGTAAWRRFAASAERHALD
jgi:hypothetical protein